jgi:FAD/FMN-containing dehydrogenase
MAGLTLAGGYGPLIGRFGLALDNLVAAEVVLADGRVVNASEDEESELFWALRGGGGNFGVVTAMHLRVHDLPSIRTGVLVYPFSEARTVVARCAELSASASDALTVQVVLACGPDGTPMVLIVPTWCGSPEQGEARLAPFLDLGTLLAGKLESMPYGRSLTLFDAFITQGQRTFMETCSVPALDDRSIDAMVESMKAAVSPGCAIITHEFRGAASRIPADATAFGHRGDHVVLELLASHVDRSEPLEAERHRRWAREALQSFDATALPGAYPTFLVAADRDRVRRSYGPNASRLLQVKRRYDPDNVFRSAIPLPDVERGADGTGSAQTSDHL